MMSGLGGTPNLPKKHNASLYKHVLLKMHLDATILGLMYLENHDLEGSFPFFQQACTYEDGRGCAQAGIFLDNKGKKNRYPTAGKELFIGRCYGLC